MTESTLRRTDIVDMPIDPTQRMIDAAQRRYPLLSALVICQLYREMVNARPGGESLT